MQRSIEAKLSEENFVRLTEEANRLRHPTLFRKMIEAAHRGAEAALCGSETTCGAIFERAPIPISLIDIKGHCVSANRALEDLLGYGRFELRSMKCQELVHPDDVDKTLELTERLRCGRRSSDQFETRLVGRDGRVIWARLTVLWVGDPARRKGLLLVLIEDITKRKEAAEAHALAVEELCLSETRLRTMVANLPVAVYRCGPDGWTFQFVGDAIEHITGHPASDFIENRVRSLVSAIHPEDLARVRMAVAETVEKRTPLAVEYRVFHADGSMRWVLDNAQGVVDTEGRFRWLDGVLIDITERKRAEEALRERLEQSALAIERERAEKALAVSEAYYREIFEELPLSIWVEDWSRAKNMIERLAQRGVKDWRRYFERYRDQLVEAAKLVRVNAINKASVDIYRGPSKEAVVATTAGDKMTEGELDAFLEQLVAFAEGKTRFAIDAREQALDGSEVVVRLRAAIPPDYRQTWSRVLYAIEDISDRDQANKALAGANQALQESEEKFRSLVSNLPGAIYRSGSDGYTIDFISDAIEEITGYAPSDFTGGRIPCLAAVIHAEDKPAVGTTVAHGISRKQPFVAEYRMCHADGSIRWVHERGQPVFDERGWLQWVDGAIFDITERKRAEDAFAESERRYEQLVELAPDLICIHCEGKVKYINPAGARMLGAESPYVLTGRAMRDFFRAEDWELVEARIKKAVEDAVPQPFMELKVVRLDGKVIDMVSAATPFTYEGKPAAQWLARDITESKLAEEVLREHEGRRNRLRARFMKTGEEVLSESEMLELVLYAARPRGDVGPLAERLLERFGSFAEVVSAEVDRLTEIKGVDEAVVGALKTVRGAALRLVRERIINRPVVSSCGELLDYLRASMAYHGTEHLRVLYLDHRNKLIADELEQNGTVDHVPLYPREVIKRALELQACALILVHNHPSGDPTPSPPDIEITEVLVQAGKPLGIAVYDHIVVTKGVHASFKSLGYL